MKENKKLNFGFLGNGISIWEDGDNGYTGHISEDRKISIDKDKTFTHENLQKIYKMADSGNMIVGDGTRLVLNPISKPTKEFINESTNKVFKLSVEKINGKEYCCYGLQIFPKSPLEYKDIPNREYNDSKKFILTNYTKNYNDKILYRIRAVKSFGSIKEGDLGGFVEKENNLSQSGESWIDELSAVSGNAIIKEDAQIYNSTISENAVISGKARVMNSQIYGNPFIHDSCTVREGVICGSTEIKDTAFVCGLVDCTGIIKEKAKIIGPRVKVVGFDLEISGDALITGGEVRNYAKIRDKAVIEGNAVVSGHAEISGNAKVVDLGKVDGYARIMDNAEVKGNALVNGRSLIRGKATIQDNAAIYQFAEVYDSAVIKGNSVVCGNAQVYEFARISQEACVSDNAVVRGNVQVRGSAQIGGNAGLSGCVIATEQVKILGNTVFRDKEILKGNSKIEHNIFNGLTRKISQNQSDNILE